MPNLTDQALISTLSFISLFVNPIIHACSSLNFPCISNKTLKISPSIPKYRRTSRIFSALSSKGKKGDNVALFIRGPRAKGGRNSFRRWV